MSQLDRPSFNAGGNVTPNSFVKLSTAANFTVLLCGANEQMVGISGDGTNAAPIEGASVYAGIAGQEIDVHLAGEQCLLKLGASSSVTTGGLMIKSDASGLGVVTGAYSSAVPQFIGALSLRGGADGELIEVWVVNLIH